MEPEIEKALENLVRVGKVSAVDESKRKVRVIFEDKDATTSGWLPVLQRFGTPLVINQNGDHSHTAPGGSTSTNGLHNHTGHITYWMPKVNETVICLYLPVFNADGFVWGAL